jgi:hypothetical protein
MIRLGAHCKPDYKKAGGRSAGLRRSAVTVTHAGVPSKVSWVHGPAGWPVSARFCASGRKHFSRIYTRTLAPLRALSQSVASRALSGCSQRRETTGRPRCSVRPKPASADDFVFRHRFRDLLRRDRGNFPALPSVATSPSPAVGQLLQPGVASSAARWVQHGSDNGEAQAGSPPQFRFWPAGTEQVRALADRRASL